MARTKIILSFALAFIFIFTQVFSVGAAPATQDVDPPATEVPTSIIGTVTDVSVETVGETTTVVITLVEDGTGVTKTVTVSLDTAINILKLVTLDAEGNPIPVDTFGQHVEIDPTTVLPPEEGEETEEHPVGSALADFFTDLLGVDYETIMTYHEDGMGFGVLAQALFMTNKLEGDTALFAAILDAKKSGDYSAVTLPDGSTPQNWGQFRNAVLKDGEKAKENLGAVMSNKDDEQSDETITDETLTGTEGALSDDKNNNGGGKGPKNQDDDENGNDKDKDKGKGKGHNK